jgi:WD40 repeat protein
VPAAHASNAWRLAVSPDGERVVTGGHDFLVKVWDTADRTSKSLTGHTNVVSGVAWSKSGLVASASFDGTARIWNADTGEPGPVCKGHTGSVTRVAFSPDGKLLATSGADGTVRLWNPTDGSPVGKPMSSGEGYVEPAVFTPDGKTLISAYSRDNRGGLICVWEVATGRLKESFPGNPNGTYALAVSADGRTLWTTGGDGCLRTFTLEPW